MNEQLTGLSSYSASVHHTFEQLGTVGRDQRFLLNVGQFHNGDSVFSSTTKKVKEKLFKLN